MLIDRDFTLGMVHGWAIYPVQGAARPRRTVVLADLLGPRISMDRRSPSVAATRAPKSRKVSPEPGAGDQFFEGESPLPKRSDFSQVPE